MSSIRALRVGVVLSDTLVAEHVVHSGSAFTIGQSIRNVAPLPVPGLPRRWQLVELVERGILLRLAPGMGARIAVDGHVLGRADLDARGAHTRVATLVTLPAGAHGKIELGGEVRVLFQELRVPAPAPAPQLPRAVKGTLAERVDRRMAVFAAASLLVHVGIMTAAHLNDPPEDKTVARRALAQYTPETISIIDADDPILDLDRAPDPATAPEPSSTPAPAADPARPSTPSTPSRPRPAQPTHADPGNLAEDATRMADLLFADRGGGKLDAGDMAARKPGNDLDKQLQEMADQNAKASIGNEQGDRLRERPGARPGTSQEPTLPGDPSIAKADGDKLDRVPPSRIDVKPQPPRTPGVNTDAIVAKIRTTYMGAMQRCYKQALTSEPTLSGKVALVFTLSEKGGVSDPDARGVSPVFEDCLEGVMPRWSFTPVIDQDGDPVELDIGVTLQLSI